MNIDASKYRMTDEELRSLKEFKKSGNRHLEDDGREIVTTLWAEPFSSMMQSFNFMVGKLDFSKPFRVTVDYDPEQKRTVVHHYAPKSE